MSYELVWFKRDLRWQDHAALANAARRGPVRCIYVIEPEVWLQADAALQHFEFVKESLHELHKALASFGGGLEIHYGEISEVLAKIWHEAPFNQMASHQETGNDFSYARDLKVQAWCKLHQVKWQEYPQFGVIRGLKNRNLWHTTWESFMALPLQNIKALHFYPSHTAHYFSLNNFIAPAHLKHNPSHRQKGGRSQAITTLRSFLSARSIGYRGGISSPLTAPDKCSRLSAYLAWGCISMREVVQQTRQQMALLPPQANRHLAGLVGFQSRLYWHCHFIQKLESEPSIEYQNMHRGYDGLREADFNQDYFEALQQARTGWPMVDACVTMLKETGWLNFRMRAMLVSVAAYPLWLHWRPVGQWLATQFLDYEPGIHWSQMQMQSGTTGINTTRVYNPIKQAQDQDPHGKFVRRWLPYMRRVPDTFLFEPWLMPHDLQAQYGLEIGKSIPLPVVDLAIATRQSKQMLHGRRQDPEVKAGKLAIVEKHASRKNLNKTKHKKSTEIQNSELVKQQLGFDF